MLMENDTWLTTAEEFSACMAESVVSVTNAYEQSPVVLKVDDAVIGTLSNFSASIGKAKSKKTFNVTAIAASALKNGKVLQYRTSFPEDKKTVLYIDTEQGRHHCQKMLKRILRLAITRQAIGTMPNLGLVIVDGIQDFPL